MMLYGFQYVDPLTGEFPGVTSRLAPLIPKRMRRLLAHRSREDLDRLILLVNTVLEEINPNGKLIAERLTIEANIFEGVEQRLLEKMLAHLPDSDEDVDILLWGIERVDLASLADDPAVEWYELFAVLALALLNVAADDEQYYGKWPDVDEWVHDWRILDHLCDWTHYAERAAAFAEALNWGRLQAAKRQPLEEQVQQEHKAILGQRNRLAALKRHEPTARATLELTKFYRENDFPSRRAAASRFCKDFPELVKHLQPDNRVRTLTNRLSTQLKAIGHQNS